METNIIRTPQTFSLCSALRIAFLSIVMSILFAINVNGQDEADQKLSLNFVNERLGNVLHILELKTNFTFSYLNGELLLNKEVNMEVKNKSLQQILDILSSKFGLTFTRIDNIITVKKNERTDARNQMEALGTLRGIIRDSLTSEVLPYANVYIPELKTGRSSDNRGFFIIPSIPAGKKYDLVVTYVGYSPQKITVFVEANKITHIDVLLNKSAIEIENVIVSGEKIEGEKISVQKISINDIEKMPGGVETDVMRAIQFLPGVQSAGDVSARYYVRGGANNENLVLINDTPIYNPFHALGIFSVIDPDLINNIEFYKGGFGPKYSGRLSSVMDIITKDGNRDRFGVIAAASQLTVKSVLEGPIPNGSFILTGRKSYSNEILKKFTNDKNIPVDFYDASFKINYNYFETPFLLKITLFGFASKDKIDYKDKIHSNFNWSNSHIGMNIFSVGKESPLFAEFTIYYSEFTGGEIPINGNTRQIENAVYDLALKGRINYVLSNSDEYYGGFSITDLKTKLLLSHFNGISKDIGNDGVSLNCYGGYKCSIMNDLKADFSTQMNVLRLASGSALFFEPRINLVYNLTPTLNLKAAWGVYQQELVTISDEDEIFALFEPWIITPEYIKPSNALHYIGGLDFYLTDKFKINLEGYYKTMQNLAVLNDNVIYPTDRQLINGSGKSYGVEIAMNYRNNWVNAQFSYSNSESIKKVNDMEYHPRYDSRHAVKFFINCELGNNWAAGINWNYNSGMPFTQIYGYYDKFDPSGIFSSSSFDTYYNYFAIMADRNAARLPDYHKLDISISKKIQLGFMDISIDLNLINIYDRKNFFYYDTETGERVNMLPFFPSIDVKVEL